MRQHSRVYDSKQQQLPLQHQEQGFHGSEVGSMAQPIFADGSSAMPYAQDVQTLESDRTVEQQVDSQPHTAQHMAVQVSQHPPFGCNT